MHYAANIGTELIKLGINPSLLGFSYMEYAIRSILENPLACYMDKRTILYRVCDEFKITRDKASRCIQYAVSTAWTNQDHKALRSIFPGCSEQYPPYVMDFLFGISLYLYSIEFGDYFTNLIRECIGLPFQYQNKTT
ncbi:MAG: sporulation initiation factor Spo0A C-terminal domain-containing protein [Eubacteriales bacterium]|nr:sporulation initiation factor Spo0A C-terminal domain-containing protein [Eubacteriales bacterium]